MDHTTRKLQKVGGGTYTISVPKDWAVERALSAGAPVDVFRNRDGSLRVQCANRDDGPLAETHISASADDAPTALVDRLRGAYTAGYETITLTVPDGFTREQRRHLGRAVRRYNGLEVVTETDTEHTVTDVLDHDAVSIEQTLTRLQFVALSHLRAGVAAIHGTQTPDTDANRDADAARLADQVARSVTRALASPTARQHVDATPATLVERHIVARALHCLSARADALDELAADMDTADVDARAVVDDLDTLAATTVTLVDDATTALLGDPGHASTLALDALAHREHTEALVAGLDDTLSTTDVPGGYTIGRTVSSLDAIGDRGRTLALIALRTAERTDTDPVARAP